MKIYTWYTTGTPYADLAPLVLADCARLGLECEAIGVPPLNSWDEACGFKAKVILSILTRETRPFWFIDVDSRVEGVPVEPSTDFAAHWFRGRELQGSVLFFRPGPRVMDLVRRWDTENVTQAGKIGDQINLMRVVTEVQGLTITQLTASHCFIFDLSRDYYGNIPSVVFRQTQASRRFKHLVTRPGHENTCQVCVPRSPLPSLPPSTF